MPVWFSDWSPPSIPPGSASHALLGPRFTRKTVKSSLGGEVYALSVMMGDMELQREFHTPFLGSGPGVAGSIPGSE